MAENGWASYLYSICLTPLSKYLPDTEGIIGNSIKLNQEKLKSSAPPPKTRGKTVLPPSRYLCKRLLVYSSSVLG